MGMMICGNCGRDKRADRCEHCGATVVHVPIPEGDNNPEVEVLKEESAAETGESGDETKA